MQASLNWGHVFVFVAVIFALMWVAKQTKSKVVLFITSVIMICVAGLRHGYVDTRAYRNGFLGHDPNQIFNPEFWADPDIRDKGFAVLQSIIKFFTDDAQVFLFIMSLVTVGCLFWAIIKYSPEMDFGIFLFITMGCYVDTMNGLRQAIVAAVLFLVLPKLRIEKKLVPYLIVVLLASTVHGSALIFIPIYFIADKKPWSASTAIVIVACLVVYVFFNTGIGDALVEILDGTSYGEDYGQMLSEGNSSVNVLRVFVAGVPVIISLLYHNAHMRKDTGIKSYTPINPNDLTNEQIAAVKAEPMYNISFNMSLISLLCWFFATKVLYFYRLAMYFTPYTIIFIIYEISCIRSAEERKIVKWITIICYFVFFLYGLYAMGNQFFVGYLKY